MDPIVRIGLQDRGSSKDGPVQAKHGVIISLQCGGEAENAGVGAKAAGPGLTGYRSNISAGRAASVDVAPVGRHRGCEWWWGWGRGIS